jgi:hypothetical protein
LQAAVSAACATVLCGPGDQDVLTARSTYVELNTACPVASSLRGVRGGIPR